MTVLILGVEVKELGAGGEEVLLHRKYYYIGSIIT